MDTTTECIYEMRTSADLEAAVCAPCGTVEWFRSGRPLSAEVALAALFGDYDLIGELDAVSAPGNRVLLYRPARGRRSALDILPSKRWFQVASGLHASHDGSHLLLSPTDVPVKGTSRGA